MKALWNAVSFVAVINLLTLALFAGWLWRTDRLSADRVNAVRDMFSLTVAEAADADALAQKEQAENAAAAREFALSDNPPLPSSAQVRQANLTSEQQTQTIRRLHDETDQLLAQLNRRKDDLNRREAELKARMDAWSEAIAADLDRKSDEQFAKTVKQYESAKPKQAKERMLLLIAENGPDQAVAYLDAMNARAATKILAEFKTADEVKLATELLEELRIFGLGAEVPEEPRNDDARADAQ
jgi:flagellar motility protein MotE (MotC chaperone)